MKLTLIIQLLLFLILTPIPLGAQVNRSNLQQYLLKTNASDSSLIFFYSRLNYAPVWVNKENARNTFALREAFHSENIIDKNKYDIKLIESLDKENALPTLDDSLDAELRITRAAVRFYSEMAAGDVTPQLSYNGLHYSPACLNIPNLLSQYISNGTLPLLLASIQAPLLEIKAIKEKITHINSIITSNAYREVKITSNKVNASNKALVTKLFQLGIIDSMSDMFPEKSLLQKVKDAQELFNLLADGVLRSTILRELNVPLKVRMQQLTLSINYYRWISCLIKNQSVIVVNIPAAYMKVYRGNKIELEMKMVVGKPSTPTPTLASKVHEIILYPYWRVPRSIATKELLPAIKRDPGYINAGNYQVLNSSGKIVDPYSVNWHALSVTNFPYLIRQSTGCDNALGLLKLNFYNPFGVYLHDTPVKGSFALYKRFFSHGCMRMEKPMELGHLVLKNNAIAIDTLEQKGCLRNQAPVTVKADVQMPVIVWYNPVGTNAKGKVVFYEDVYGKFYR